MPFQTNMESGLYTALRENGAPTMYGENKTAVTVDVLIAGLFFCFGILFFTFYITILGVRGKQAVYVYIRVTVSLFIGMVILVGNFGQSWEVGSINTATRYKAFAVHDVNATIGIKIGLRSVNITLTGKPIHQLNETINYNERFSWEWAQGRLGFGPQAGRINREFRAAQIKGLPYPILWTAEYFTLDGEGIRFGRHYRTAGWYCHVALWTAFPLWLLTNILFFMVIRYGCYFLALTGGSLLLANIIFISIRNVNPLQIPFESGVLALHYGWCFWLVLSAGILCVILTAVILYMDLRYPEAIYTFFGVDVLQDYEDYYADPIEQELPNSKVKFSESTTEVNDEDGQSKIYALKKRSVSNRFQRSTILHPNPAPRLVIRTTDSTLYENLPHRRFDQIEEEFGTSSQENIVLKEM